MRKITQLIIMMFFTSMICYGQDPPTVSGFTLVCSGNNTSLTASGESGATFDWYDAPTGGNHLGSTAELTTGSLTANTHFYVEQTVGGMTSTRTAVLVNIFQTPSPDIPMGVTASPAIICQGTSSNLSATVDSAGQQTVHWYDAPTGGNLLGISGTGEAFSVSPTTTTTYYAQSQLVWSDTIFDFTANTQTFTVPAGITSITVDAYGGRGGDVPPYDGPGLGGHVQAIMSVTPGQILNIFVGGRGGDLTPGSWFASGGFNGGHYGSDGAGGGGATDIRINGIDANDRVLVAGAAGGRGTICNEEYSSRPHGGGLTGGSGSYCDQYGEESRGLGGTQTEGGRAGAILGAWGGPGEFRLGGFACYIYGAGGGGGWYGGGGSLYKADAGGGSSYTAPTLFRNVVHNQGVRDGNGMMIISYSSEPIDCANSTRIPVTVTVDSNPTVTTSGDVNNCSGAGVTLSASGADNYVWMPGNLNGSSITVNPSSYTLYSVIGTNGICADTSEVKVFASDANASEDVTICIGDSTTLTGSGAERYSWYPLQILSDSVRVSPTVTTTYIVSAISGSCYTTDVVTVTVNTNPITISASNDTIILSGEAVTLSANGADTYTWEPGALSGQSITVAPSVSTTYTATGTTSSCSDTEEINVGVVPLPPNVSGALTVCEGSGTQLVATGEAGAAFIWYDAPVGGNILSAIDTLHTGSLSNNTHFYVAQTIGGYTSPRKDISVSVIPNPSPLFPENIQAVADTICVGETTGILASVDASTSQMVYWYDAPTGGNLLGLSASGEAFDVSPTVTRTYYAQSQRQPLLSVNCASETRVPITVEVLPLPVVVLSNDVYNCPGMGVTLSASGADSYVWMPGNLSGASITVDPDSTTIYTATGTVGDCSNSSNVTVFVSDVIAPEDLTMCLGDTITLTASGSTNYSWEPGNLTGASVMVSPTVNTTFTVTGTDPGGCITTDQVTVTVNPVPTVTTSNDTLILSGADVVLSASGADSYSWEPGALTASSVTVTPGVSTTYTVSGFISATSCSSTEEINVGVIPLAPSVSGVVTLCEGSSTQLVATGVAGAAFTWYDAPTGGNILSSIDTLNTTSLSDTIHFYVEQSIGGQTSDRTETIVFIIPTPSPLFPDNVQANATTICHGETTGLQANVDASTNQVVHWYDASTGGNLLGTSASGETFNVSPTTTTTYYAQSQRQPLLPLNCASETRVPITVTVIPLPVVVASNDVYNCPGIGVLLTASGADSYTWEPGGLSGASISVDPAATSTYTVTGTTGMCSNSDEVVVSVSDVVASADVDICKGSTTTLTASGSDTYTWEPGTLSGASIDVSPANSTLYTVTSSDPSSCVTTDSVWVIVNGNQLLTASNDTLVGLGSSVTLTASGADTYSWSPGGLGQSITVTPNSTTTYTVTGSYSATGCTATEEVVVTIVNLPNISGVTTVLVNEPTTLSASGASGTTFSWHDAETGGNLLSSDPNYTTPALMQNSVIYVALSDGPNTSPRVPVNITVIDSTIISAAAADSIICLTSSTELIADLNSTGQVHWYDSLTAGNLIGSTESGLGLTVSPNGTKTYYVEGENQKTTENFYYTGNVQTFTVPLGVTSIELDVYGARGGSSYGGSGSHARGGRVQATMNVTPGEVLNIYVGGQGQSYNSQPDQLAGGWNGGGIGPPTGHGAGGGGATDIRINGTTLNDRVIVAGGGGGKAPKTCFTSNTVAGTPSGGGLVGASGFYCTGGSGEGRRGRGGSQTAGGRRGSWYGAGDAAQGGFGYGGHAGTSSHYPRGGGGGGGWYGGGGGVYSCDGGGGSSYTKPRLFQNVVHTRGVQNGHGKVAITYSKDSKTTARTPVRITVTTEDEHPPVPDNGNIDGGGEQPYTVPVPTATDQCMGPIIATTNDPLMYSSPGSYLITWYFDDGNGNITTQYQTIVVTAVLPVELSDFSAHCEGQQVKLNWRTASEINSSHFEIQHSKDGIQWEALGTVESIGDSEVSNDYQFTAESRFGFELYRLKQIDYNGNSDFSKIINASCAEDNSQIKIYPNPTDGNFTVSYTADAEEELNLILIDNLGQRLEERSLILSDGFGKTNFDLSRYPPGLYNLQVSSLGRLKSYRIIKIQK